MSAESYAAEASRRLMAFKDDLLPLTSQDILRKHIVTQSSCMLSHDQEYALRSKVAAHFDVHPNDIIIVGSAKLGFSIAPTKRFRSFGNRSDVDVAIVSSQLFDRLWLDVFGFWQEYRNQIVWPAETEFYRYLFRGWIRPDKMPPEGSYPLAKTWRSYFRELSADDSVGPYVVRAGLYRTWNFLEGYQVTAIDLCRAALETETGA